MTMNMYFKHMTWRHFIIFWSHSGRKNFAEHEICEENDKILYRIKS